MQRKREREPLQRRYNFQTLRCWLAFIKVQYVVTKRMSANFLFRRLCRELLVFDFCSKHDASSTFNCIHIVVTTYCVQQPLHTAPCAVRFRVLNNIVRVFLKHVYVGLVGTRSVIQVHLKPPSYLFSNYMILGRLLKNK